MLPLGDAKAADAFEPASMIGPPPVEPVPSPDDVPDDVPDGAPAEGPPLADVAAASPGIPAPADPPPAGSVMATVFGATGSAPDPQHAPKPSGIRSTARAGNAGTRRAGETPSPGMA